MGVLGDAIAAYAGVASGQTTAQEAARGLGKDQPSEDYLIELLTLIEKSQGRSSSIVNNMNTVEERRIRSNLDAQLTYQKSLQDQLEGIRDRTSADYNEARSEYNEIVRAENDRIEDLIQQRTNSNTRAMGILSGAGNTQDQWIQLVGFLATDGSALTDLEKYTTMNAWTSVSGGNPDFMDMEAFNNGDLEAVREHLSQNGLEGSQLSRAMSFVENAQSPFIGLRNAQQRAEETRQAAEDLLNPPPGTSSTDIEQRLNTIRGNIETDLSSTDPITGLTQARAEIEFGSIKESLDMLEEQSRFRDDLRARTGEDSDALRRGVGDRLSNPDFQQWASDRGYNVGYKNSEGTYIPGRQDEIAILAFARESRRDLHSYGIISEGTGSFIEIPHPDGGTVGVNAYRIPNLDRQGDLTVEKMEELGFTVFENDDGSVNIDHPRLGSIARNLTPSVTSKPRTIVVERATTHARRVQTQPGMIEVIMPPDGRIVVMDPDDIVQTVGPVEGRKREIFLGQSRTARGRMNRLDNFLERLVGRGIIDPESEEIQEYSEGTTAARLPRWQRRRVEQEQELDDVLGSPEQEQVAPPGEVASTEPARALRLPNGRSIYQRANGDFVTPGGRVIAQTQDDGSPNPQWSQMQDQTGQASWEDVPEQEVSQFVSFADEVRATETPTLTERDQFELPGVPSDTPTLTRAPARTVTLPNGSVVTQRANGDFVLPGGGVLSLRQEDGKSPNPNWIRLNNQLEGSPWEGEDPFSAQGIDFPFSDQEMATMTTVLDTDLPEPGEPDGLPGDTELQPASREWTAPWGDGEVVYAQNEAGDITYTDPDTGDTKTVTAESNPSAHSAILNQKDLIRRRRAEYVDSQRSIETDPKTSISEEYRPSPVEVPTVEPEPLEIEEPVSTPRPEVPNLTPLRDISKPLEVPSVEPEPLEMATPTTERAPTRAETPATPKADDRQPQRRLMGMFNRETPLFQNLRNRRDKKNGK